MKYIQYLLCILHSRSAHVLTIIVDYQQMLYVLTSLIIKQPSNSQSIYKVCFGIQVLLEN